MKQQPHDHPKIKYGILKHSQTETPKLNRKTLLQKYHEDKKNHQQKQDERNIGQNISLIATINQASFISNKQDRSLDSFDKMIIEGNEELDLEDQYKIEKLGSSYGQEQQKSKILQQQLFEQEEQKSKDQSFEININNLSHIKTLKIKLQEIKQLKKQKSATSNPDISIRLQGANLSQINEEEIQHNTSINRMDPIQEEFINFVGKNNQTNKINISKIQKYIVREQKKANLLKNELNNSLKQAQEDEVVAMLQNELGSRRQNLIEQSMAQDEQLSQLSRQKKKSTKSFYEKQNYNYILKQLDQNQDKKLDFSQLNISSILTKRQEWINNRKDKSVRWKNKQLAFLNKIKEISHNPYVQFSDSEQIEE